MARWLKDWRAFFATNGGEKNKMKTSKEYHVVWEIDVLAESPLEAAIAAREAQRPNTSALVFDVFDEDGEKHTIDLCELEGGVL